MNKFTPQWVSAPTLDTATEGNAFSATLVARNYTSVTLDIGETTLDLGRDYASVTAFHANGSPLPFTVAGTAILFAPLAVRAVVEVWLSTPITYTIIGGNLPKGLTLSTSGVLSGTPYGIRDVDGEVHAFTVRASNGGKIRDRTFRLLVYPVAQAAVWNTTSLPLPLFDAQVATKPYYQLGDLHRGEAFSFTLDVSDPDGDTIVMGAYSDDAVIAGDGVFNGSLPPGLAIVGTGIEGVVLPSTAPGKYFFTLNITAPLAPPPVFAMIEVLSGQVTTFKRPVKMQWVTAAGSLGVLLETETATMSVKAADPNGGNVVYALLAGTGQLPDGLSLNGQTGDIEGQVGYVTEQKQFGFTVRATSGSIFADRAFTIEVDNHYDVDAIATVKLKFQGRDRKLLTQAYPDLIPADWVFRPDDSNFGLVADPTIHVAKGILPDRTLSKLEYRNNIECRLGEHRSATILDAVGKPLYDVVYRIIVDPMDEDPMGTDVRADGLVVDYRQSKADLKIHPMSIWNMRYDLLAEYDEGHGDMLPQWLATVSGADGYVTATAVAYLNAGFGAAATTLLNAADTLPKPGYAVTFDRVMVSFFGMRRLHFDTQHPRLLPVYIAPNQNQMYVGRWVTMIEEVFVMPVTTADDGTLQAVVDHFTTYDMNDFNIDVDSGQIAIGPVDFARYAYFSVTGTPPASPRAHNAPVGTDLLLGPFAAGVSRVLVDDMPITLSDLVIDEVHGTVRKSDGWTTLGEVVVDLSETTFDDDTTLFDHNAQEIGRYVKLSDDFPRVI